MANNPDVIPYLVSSDLAVGRNRFLMTLIDSKNKIIASADFGVTLRFFNLARDPATPTASATAVFLDNGNSLGLYRSVAEFGCWGDWGVEVVLQRPSGSDTARVIFDVHATSSTIGLGQPAPPVDTPTATNAAGIAAISTDPSPDPAYYRMTIGQAVTSGKPTLIVFATPAFCKTATCGPTLSRVKSAAEPFKAKVNLVHVEPYKLQKTDAGLQPLLDANGQLQPVPAADDYGLINEPFTYVVDASGRVSAKFDGIMGADELQEALNVVTAGQ